MKKILATVALVTLTVSAFAANGFDLFGIPRVVQITAPTAMTSATLSNTAAGCSAVNVQTYSGDGVVIITAATGPASGAVTFTLVTSPDCTNWVPCTYALATSTVISNKCTAYGGAINTTNTYFLPGTLTTPSAYASGWATPYIVAAQFTNTAALTVTTAGTYVIGLNMDDQQRYIAAQWAGPANVTNTVSAVLIGRSLYP